MTATIASGGGMGQGGLGSEGIASGFSNILIGSAI